MSAAISIGAMVTAALLSIAWLPVDPIEEIVLPPAERGFLLHEMPPTPGGQTLEYRLRGETGEAWSRVITLVRFDHPPAVRDRMVAEAKSVAALPLIGLAAAIRLSCPGATLKVGDDYPVEGLASHKLKAQCAHDSRTSASIVTTARTVIGQDATHVVMAQVRGSRTRGDERWATRVIDSLTVCRTGKTEGRCASRSRTIGDPL
jgi:hypothetical protein